MITDPGKQILDKDNGMFKMLEEGKADELRMMYKLFKIRPDSLVLFKEKLTLYIVENVTRIANQYKNEIDRISLLIEFRNQMFDFLNQSFDNDQLMKLTLISAFDKVVGDCQTTTVDLVRYIDKMFAEFFAKHNDEQNDGKVKSIMDIFIHVSDKDIF